MIGKRSSICSAMNMRGMSGKWKFMCDSSPSPKYATASSGHWFASASSMRFVKFRVDVRAEFAEVLMRLWQILADRVFLARISKGLRQDEVHPRP